jgi:hypothetical protein
MFSGLNRKTLNISQQTYDFHEISLTKNVDLYTFIISFGVVSMPFIYRNNKKI